MKLHLSTHWERGLTIGEILCLLAVLALSVLAGSPSFSGYIHDSSVCGSANELMADIHFARTLAVSKERTYYIELHPPTYSIVDSATGNVLRSRDLPPGFNFAAVTDSNLRTLGVIEPVRVDVMSGGVMKKLFPSTDGRIECR
ncbi:MAG: hypothetical protein ABIA59_11260 [Candidatus Latescibacterota bacterium]